MSYCFNNSWKLLSRAVCIKHLKPLLEAFSMVSLLDIRLNNSLNAKKKWCPNFQSSYFKNVWNLLSESKALARLRMFHCDLYNNIELELEIDLLITSLSVLCILYVYTGLGHYYRNVHYSLKKRSTYNIKLPMITYMYTHPVICFGCYIWHTSSDLMSATEEVMIIIMMMNEVWWSG